VQRCTTNCPSLGFLVPLALTGHQHLAATSQRTQSAETSAHAQRTHPSTLSIRIVGRHSAHLHLEPKTLLFSSISTSDTKQVHHTTLRSHCHHTRGRVRPQIFVSFFSLEVDQEHRAATTFSGNVRASMCAWVSLRTHSDGADPMLHAQAKLFLAGSPS
jgi:hypothetical protein